MCGEAFDHDKATRYLDNSSAGAAVSVYQAFSSAAGGSDPTARSCDSTFSLKAGDSVDSLLLWVSLSL